ncbi:MAG UNVERIFIED_CONTAM: hypothetical protein LVR29_21800 [Microcystis novacekii LVE1205-3]
MADLGSEFAAVMTVRFGAGTVRYLGTKQGIAGISASYWVSSRRSLTKIFFYVGANNCIGNWPVDNCTFD